MTLEDLTQGFYNLLAQMQAEQVFSDNIFTAMGQHADSLDQAEAFVKELQLETGRKIEVHRQQGYSAMTADINQLYGRITSERDDATSHRLAGVVEGSKKLYHEISAERAKHVEESGKILNMRMDELIGHVYKKIEEL